MSRRAKELCCPECGEARMKRRPDGAGHFYLVCERSPRCPGFLAPPGAAVRVRRLVTRALVTTGDAATLVGWVGRAN